MDKQPKPLQLALLKLLTSSKESLEAPAKANQFVLEAQGHVWIEGGGAGASVGLDNGGNSANKY